MARAWLRTGAEVRVATPRWSDSRGSWDQELECKVVTLEPRNWRWLGRWRERGETWGARKLARAVTSDWVPDLIWERHSLFVDAGQRLANRLHIPRVVELNAPLSIERPNVRATHRAVRLERSSLVAAQSVVAVSAWLAKWAVDLGCAPDRVKHLPNGTDIEPGDRTAGRARWNLEGLVIGFVGSCRPWHRLDVLPAILADLPSATALVVGDGPAPPPPHPRIRHVGRVKPAELPDLLAAMDVGLAPASNQQRPWICPLKLLDYRAAGIPVVASDVGDAAALLGPHDTVLPGLDPATWAQAIRQAVSAPRQSSVRSWDQVLAASAAQGLTCA
jgi:glycosyltransferase involved in cell wall biosynthesis